MPPNSDTLARFPSDDTLTNSIHNPDDFMPRNSWVLNAWKNPLLCNRIAVTNSTGLHPDSYRSRTWLRDFTFHNFKWSIRSRDLNCAHFRHNSPVLILVSGTLNPSNAGPQGKIEKTGLISKRSEKTVDAIGSRVRDVSSWRSHDSFKASYSKGNGCLDMVGLP